MRQPSLSCSGGGSCIGPPPPVMPPGPEFVAAGSTCRGPPAAVRDPCRRHGSSFSVRLDIEHLRPAERHRQRDVIHQDENDRSQAEQPRIERSAVLVTAYEEQQDKDLEHVGAKASEHHRLRARPRRPRERDHAQAEEHRDDNNGSGSANHALVPAYDSADRHHDGGHRGRHECGSPRHRGDLRRHCLGYSGYSSRRALAVVIQATLSAASVRRSCALGLVATCAQRTTDTVPTCYRVLVKDITSSPASPCTRSPIVTNRASARGKPLVTRVSCQPPEGQEFVKTTPDLRP